MNTLRVLSSWRIVVFVVVYLRKAQLKTKDRRRTMKTSTEAKLGVKDWAAVVTFTIILGVIFAVSAGFEKFSKKKKV